MAATQARRDALKFLVPQVHQIAALLSFRRGGELVVAPADEVLYRNVRRIADRLDRLAAEGSAADVAAFFGEDPP